MNKQFQPSQQRQGDPNFQTWELHSMKKESDDKARMSESAQKELELQAIRDQAYQEGFAQGQVEAKKQGDEIVQQLSFWLNVVSHPSEQIEQSIKNEIVACIFWICKHCIHVELTTNPDKLKAIFDAALSQLPSLREGKKLYVNGQDLEWVEDQLLPKDREVLMSVASVDPSLSRGEFYMKDEQSEVDGTLEVRLKKILQQHLPLENDFILPSDDL